MRTLTVSYVLKIKDKRTQRLPPFLTAAILIILIFLFSPIYGFAEETIDEIKILPDDGLGSNYFGSAVSISGNVAIVGAYGDDANGISNSGSAYIFVNDGTGWTQQAKLTASDALANDLFGASVALSGDYAIIGAYGRDENNMYNVGAAYIFKRDGNEWYEQAKLTADDGAENSYFGYSVDISGDYAVAGSYNYTSPCFGAAYVFKRQPDGGWIQEAKLTASDGDIACSYAYALSISSDYIAIGARTYGDPDNDILKTGAVYINKREESGWIEQTVITPADGAANDNFGASVVLSGGALIVGAEQDDDNGNGSGSAYIYRFDGTDWIEEAKLTPDDGENGDNFGIAVSIFADFAVVGSINSDGVEANSGAAYIFEKTVEGWSQLHKLTAGDGAKSDNFGTAVSVYGGTVIIGAKWDDDNETNSGSAYIYPFSSTPVEIPTLSVTPSEQSVSEAAGRITFNVSNTGTGTMNWTAGTTDAWLTISGGDSGVDSGVVTVDYEANPGAERVGVITVTAPDAPNSPQTVEIRQSALVVVEQPILSVTPAIHNVPAYNGLVAFDVANTGSGVMEWTAEVSEPWLSIIDGASGTDAGVVYVEYEENPGDKRSGYLTVTAPNAENSPISVEIKQHIRSNGPPTLSDIPDWILDIFNSEIIIDFTVDDDFTPLENLVVTAESSEDDIIPDDNIVVEGDTETRRLRITPIDGVFGTTTITVNVDDGEAVVSDTFDLTLNPPFGNLNHDDAVDLADAILTFKISSNIPVEETIYLDADINGDHHIDFIEGLYIMQVLAELR